MKNAAVMFGSADDGSEARRAAVSSAGNADNVPMIGGGLPVESEPSPTASPYDQRGVVIVASVWLALYVMMIVSSAISPANQKQQASVTVQARSGKFTTD